MNMATGSQFQERLTRISHSIRAILRYLGGSRESQSCSQRAFLLFCDLMDLLRQFQLISSEEQLKLDSSYLHNMDEGLCFLESTIDTIEIYFQPGGVAARTFRKRLLENTFVPRLEQFKVMLILGMQPKSRSKTIIEEKLREKLQQFQDLDTDSMQATTPICDNYREITSKFTTKTFKRLAEISKRRQEGTCEWIFDNEKYNNWLFGGIRTLYCVAPAGSGKTFLASAIVDNLQKTFTSPDVAIVFILGQEEGDEGPDSIGFMDKMLAQLVSRKRNPSHASSLLYRSESFEKGRASAKEFQDALFVEVNRFTRVIFVIDDIDTHPEKDRILNRLQKLPEHVQVLVTLREARHVSQDEQLSVFALREDLETYVSSRIDDDENFCSIVKQSCPKSTVIHQVVQLSHGLFLLARLHMDLLSRCTDGSFLEAALYHLPENLNDSFGESMTQTVSKSPFASRCLYWTLYALRPLNVSELQFAATFLSLSDNSKKSRSFTAQDIVQEAAGLLSIDPETENVYLVHKTAKEYLSGPAARVFFPTAKKGIADTCLTIITSDEVVDECYSIPENNSCKSRGILLEYAATYWGHHAREVGEDESTTKFLSRAFLNKLCWRRPPVDPSSMVATEIPTQLGFGSYFPDWSGMHILAYFGIVGKTRRLLEQGADVNDADNKFGITALHCAAHRGHEEVVGVLLDHKADINATSKDGNSALHIAIEQGHRKIIRLLLHRQINPRLANKQGNTALQHAIGTAFDEVAAPLLVKSRFNMDIQNTVTGNTAVHIAIELRRSRILLFLLEKGASMNILNRNGLNPLQLACKIDNCEAVSYLLERGAKPESRSSQGETALHIAATEGNWVAFDLLVIGSADINAWGKDGESLLHQQARLGRTTSISLHLLENGANMEARNSRGLTPLQCAAVAGNKLMFLFLMKQGANIEVQTPKGETLLHIVPPQSQDCLDILSSLLDINFNPNAKTFGGWTPLHHLILNHVGHLNPSCDKTIEYISLLLSYGADLNAELVSENSETPLHLAVISKFPCESLVTFLIKNGALVDARTTQGKSPLHLAAECGRNNLFNILAISGANSLMKSPDISSIKYVNKFAKNEEEAAVQNQADETLPDSKIWLGEKNNFSTFLSEHGRQSATTSIEELEITSEIDEMGSKSIEDDFYYI